MTDHHPARDASVVVARDTDGLVALLSAHFPRHGAYAMTLGSPARVHLFEARHLTLGPQELTPTEQDFTLSWWSMSDAIDAVSRGRFLLPAGPLALLLADRTGHFSRAPSDR
ncbi:hypothetical protein [Streptomyces sp. RTd22]|uniref:hypothetical protein n=1 Tax=Streptomyces sp. RTd22 TaxID=1841249 RepID=UPI0007C4EB7E|nr:hypothetical protein [Streptomyces sp. RTd22]